MAGICMRFRVRSTIVSVARRRTRQRRLQDTSKYTLGQQRTLPCATNTGPVVSIRLCHEPPQDRLTSSQYKRTAAAAGEDAGLTTSFDALLIQTPDVSRCERESWIAVK
ncbi:hypothetical protein PISMIDRAFT_434196 [Pisolithus microcarpus 441]|uniref:Uncharacterized protein n=1 Tax=Pisolithus microcarpus 441 TaxID=765257 RepID=A0A0C9YQD9_9AGAM|nr:hypothetical protein PISMIDRAFT_434196 [Pisolithus microcarpus 441]